MPSSYSPDLRIELIANGEQSGTWGATTNNNLGTLIEDAISGLVSVNTISTNQALTAQNGVTDQARCAAISLNTLTGAPFAVYIPPVTKLYVIQNASAYTATVYCSTVLGNTTAAGTGVVIPAGKSVLIRSTGVNVVEQLNHVVGNLSIGGALSLGTSLAVTSGGTGQTSYTVGDLLYASATTTLSKLTDVATGNALLSGGVGVAPSYGKIGLTTHVSGTLPVANGGTGVTTSTGTGSVVLSTNPILLTPALGTPSSGNLANCTFPTLNQNTTGTASNVTGIVAVANGGTGVTTSTGTGSVVLSTSPTLVTPALGTPSSGTLTNATGLPLTTGVTGILPIANGGTGNNTGQVSVDLATQVTGTLSIANGGTGATTRQNAMDALAGAVTTGQYLRGNGADVVMSAIQAADVPTLNQNTTGTAANVTGTVAIANGGTGATTAATALTNLGAYAASNPSGYTSNTGTVTSVTAGTGLSGGTITTTGTIALADSGVTTAKIADANVTAAKLNGAQSGSAPIYGARAFGNVAGNGTLSSGFNVASTSRNSEGSYSVTFTTAMPSAAYAVVGSGLDMDSERVFNYGNLSTTGFTVSFRGGGGTRDDTPFSFVVFA